MKVSIPRYLCALVVCLSFPHIPAFAQSLEYEGNLAACTNGWESCNHSKLTQPEAGALVVAERERNYTPCLQGYGYCDRARLTPSEASGIPAEGTASPR